MDFKGLAKLIKKTKTETTLATTCPIDGFPLEADNKNRGMRCPFCGWPNKDRIRTGGTNA